MAVSRAPFLLKFVDAGRGDAAWQIIALGGVVIAVALVWESCLILGAGVLSRRLRAQPAIVRRINWASSATLIWLGVQLAAEQR